MNIEQFYAQDERRRISGEVELGRTWTDEGGASFALSFVEDTGELYLMSEPATSTFEDPLGDYIVNPLSVEPLVEVLGAAEDLDAVHVALDGWQDAIGEPASLRWLRARLASAGIAKP